MGIANLICSKYECVLNSGHCTKNRALSNMPYSKIATEILSNSNPKN